MIANIADLVGRTKLAVPLAVGAFVIAGLSSLFQPGYTLAPLPDGFAVASRSSAATVAGRTELAAVPAPTEAGPRTGRSVASGPLSLPQTDVDRLVERGQAMIGAGDFAAARLLLTRAAEAGHPGAAFALASTYDPNVLSSAHVVGLVGEPGQAKALYAKALAAGVSDARQRIAALGG